MWDVLAGPFLAAGGLLVAGGRCPSCATRCPSSGRCARPGCRPPRLVRARAGRRRGGSRRRRRAAAPGRAPPGGGRVLRCSSPRSSRWPGTAAGCWRPAAASAGRTPPRPAPRRRDRGARPGGQRRRGRPLGTAGDLVDRAAPRRPALLVGFAACWSPHRLPRPGVLPPLPSPPSAAAEGVSRCSPSSSPRGGRRAAGRAGRWACCAATPRSCGPARARGRARAGGGGRRDARRPGAGDDRAGRGARLPSRQRHRARRVRAGPGRRRRWRCR